MSSTWLIVIGIALVFFIVNAAFAYRYRSRQLRAQGREPPPFLVYLFFPRPFASRVPMPKPLRVTLGVLIVAGGAAFILGGTLLLSTPAEEQAYPLGVVVPVVLLLALGAFFGYVGYRLIVMRSAETLFRRTTKKNDAA